MTARFAAALLALALPVAGFAQTAELGEEAKQLAAAIAAEGCVLTQANNDAVQSRLTGMNDESAMAASVQLIIGGFLVEEGEGAFRLKGLGC